MPGLRPHDLRNPSRASGFNYVGYAASTRYPSKKPYQAMKRPSKAATGNRAIGPRRTTALEAAQDYCDYVNGNPQAQVPQLRSAGHTTKRGRQAVPQEVKDARAVIAAHARDTSDPSGYVYLIGELAKHCSFVKIGESRDDPSHRLAELQTGNPRLLVLLGKIKTGDRRALEAKLHARFIKHNVLGEWFINRPEIRKAFA